MRSGAALKLDQPTLCHYDINTQPTKKVPDRIHKQISSGLSIIVDDIILDIAYSLPIKSVTLAKCRNTDTNANIASCRTEVWLAIVSTFPAWKLSCRNLEIFQMARGLWGFKDKTQCHRKYTFRHDSPEVRATTTVHPASSAPSSTDVPCLPCSGPLPREAAARGRAEAYSPTRHLDRGHYRHCSDRDRTGRQRHECHSEVQVGPLGRTISQCQVDDAVGGDQHAVLSDRHARSLHSRRRSAGHRAARRRGSRRPPLEDPSQTEGSRSSARA